MPTTTTSVHATEAVLLDHEAAIIRRLVPADHEALDALFDAASDENIYRRFFGLSRRLAHSFVDCVCHEDDQHWALVAEVGGRVVGVFDAELTADHCADVSLFVADDLHRHGVGTALLRTGADELLKRDVTTLTADVLTANTAMLHVFAKSGFEVSMHRNASVVDVTISLTR